MRLFRWGLAALAAVSLVTLITPASADLKPGTKLNKANCQEAKDLLPENVMEKFCNGQYEAEIVEVKDDAFQYSAKFKAGSEANAGHALCYLPEGCNAKVPRNNGRKYLYDDDSVYQLRWHHRLRRDLQFRKNIIVGTGS